MPIYEQMDTNHWACFHHFPANKLEERLLHMDALALNSSPCKGNPCYFPCSLCLSSIPCVFPVCPRFPRPHSEVLSGNPETPETPETPECSRRPPEHSTHRQAPLPGTPLYSPLPRSFLCTCHVILAGFPQSILFGSSLARSVVSSPCLYILFLYILFGSSLASWSDFLSTARLPLHLPCDTVDETPYCLYA